MKKLNPSDKGQSILEVIIAVSIFVVIASSSVVAVLGSFLTSRLAEEETKATVIAVEGMEAVQSIRNKEWDNLIDGSFGLSNASGEWEFSGASDTDSSGKFTRTVSVFSVERDANGDIVETGGTVDPETKRVVCDVSWDFTSARQNTVQLTSYFTNWQESSGQTAGEATPTPTPTPEITTCNDYCISIGYSGGICRANNGECNQNDETGESGGNQYCTGGASADTCCCQP